MWEWCSWWSVDPTSAGSYLTWRPLPRQDVVFEKLLCHCTMDQQTAFRWAELLLPLNLISCPTADFRMTTLLSWYTRGPTFIGHCPLEIHSTMGQNSNYKYTYIHIYYIWLDLIEISGSHKRVVSHRLRPWKMETFVGQLRCDARFV